MSNEIERVLKMVEEGKIDSQKGLELIEALKKEDNLVVYSNNDDKMMKIKVNSSDGDIVNVNLPVKFIKGIIKSTGKIPINISGMESQVDTQFILEAIDSGLLGKIVDIKSANGDIVEIVIE